MIIPLLCLSLQLPAQLLTEISGSKLVAKFNYWKLSIIIALWMEVVQPGNLSKQPPAKQVAFVKK